MISALGTGFALSAMLLAILHANQPKAKRVRIRVRDADRRGRPDA